LEFGACDLEFYFCKGGFETIPFDWSVFGHGTPCPYVKSIFLEILFVYVYNRVDFNDGESAWVMNRKMYFPAPTAASWARNGQSGARKPRPYARRCPIKNIPGEKDEKIYASGVKYFK
jgi:hypothetical protein